MLLVYIWPSLKCRLYLVCAIWAHKPLARWLHYHLLNSWIYSGFSLYLCVTYQVVVPLLVSEDEKALVICISCLTKVHPLLHVTSYVSKFSQLRFSVIMIESTLQQTFVGHLITWVFTISHFFIQVDSLQCYFFCENSSDVWKYLHWTACWQTSFRGAHGKIAFLLASAVWCIWQPKCRSPKGTHIVFFFLSWLLLLLSSGSLFVLVL